MNNIFLSQLSLVILHCNLQSVVGNAVINKQAVLQNATFYDNHMEDLEIPDSSLMLFNNINIKRIAYAKYYEDARARKKEKQKQKPQKPPNQKPPQKPGSEEDDDDEEEETVSKPCTCVLGVCTCCTGYVLNLFNQKACMKVAYHPGDFAFDVTMSLNDRVLYENSLSGKNPKPICISPPRVSNLKVCAQFYNVFFPGRNIHFCLMMNGKWRQTELFSMPFNCLRMGANGIAMMGPDENGGLEIPNPQGGGVDAVVDSGPDDIEDYDENVVKSLLDIFDR